MEPTFAAEGDYDYGSVIWGPTLNGLTKFTLAPDDHPDTSIAGVVEAPPRSSVVAVTLKGVPLEDDIGERTIYYCRFEEPGTET